MPEPVRTVRERTTHDGWDQSAGNRTDLPPRGTRRQSVLDLGEEHGRVDRMAGPFACLATRLDEGESRELASFMDGHRVPSVFDLCRIEQVVISGAANIATRWAQQSVSMECPLSPTDLRRPCCYHGRLDDERRFVGSGETQQGAGHRGRSGDPRLERSQPNGQV